jgi:lysozyme
LHGIDVSSYQPGNIISLVAGSIDFVFIKATEGTQYVSNACDQQVQDAIRLGKKWGFYHFADGGDATTEADHFVDNTQTYFGHGIPVLDFEANAVSRGGGWARTFLDRVHNRTGVKPLIYTSESVAGQTDMQTVVDGDYGLWNANWGSNPAGGFENTPSTSGSGVWPFAIVRQFSSNGVLPGFDGRLDLNVFFGDANLWDQYAGSTTSSIGEDDMAIWAAIDDWNLSFLVVPGRYIIYITADDQHVAAATALASKTVHLNSGQAQALLDECAMGNVPVAALQDLPNTQSKILVCNTLGGFQSFSPTLSDDQVKNIAASISGGITAGASADQVETIVTNALKGLKLGVLA